MHLPFYFMQAHALFYPTRCFFKDFVQLPSAWPPQRAFPNHEHPPPRSDKCIPHLDIARAIAAKFLFPESLARPRPSEEMAVMAVPETPIYENHGAPTWLHDIRFPGKSG